MDVKNILISKTFWMALLPTIAGIFGMGDVLVRDEALAGDTALWIVSLISTIGGAGAIYGRWTAKTQVTIPKLGVYKGTLPVLMALVLIMPALGGCTTVKEVFGQEKADNFEEVTLKATTDALDGWVTVQGLMLIYIQSPPCGPDVVVILCSKPKQVAQLRRIDKLVSGELERLRPLFEARPNDIDIMLAITSIVTNGYNAYHQTMKEVD